jgi:glycosyltransferase involved in cell wall biosynthesis
MPTEAKINVLYISYDGMTDQLGQSQVIPYLEGLSKAGYAFTLLSFEKKDRFEKYHSEVSSLLSKSNIEWVPLTYTKKPPILSTVWDVWRMKQKAFELHQQKKFRIVHCRSYLSSLVGLQMKREFGVKFIFDMRAFYADERVDGKLWNLAKPAYKMVFNFFKKKEKEFLAEADHVITLTQKAKEIIHSWKEIPNQPVPIEVIPCCCDLDLFSQASVDQKLLQQLRSKFLLTQKDFVLCYLGSLGTWYMLDEMLDFFKCLRERIPNSKFLFITNDSPEIIFQKASEKSINNSALIVSPAPRAQVPTFLSLATWCVFFIQPVFSKAGSSPTKQGELMGMGLPLVCNAGVGDVDAIVRDSQSGLVLNDFSRQTYLAAIDKMLAARPEAATIRQGAFKYYSLEQGVESYLAVYRS